MRVTFTPCETNAPLIVNTDTELSFTITLELLEPIGWRHANILQRSRSVEHEQLPERDSLKVGR